MHMFVSFQDFVGKNKALFCLKPGQIRQRRGIYLTQVFWICEVNLMLKIFSLVNCLSLVRETFQTVKLSWKGGKGKSETGKLKINQIVSRSVIYLPGRTQGSEF